MTQGPLEHVESIGFLDEARVLSVVASENGNRARLDRGVTSSALVSVDAPQHPLMVLHMSHQDGTTSSGKLLFPG